MVNGHKKKILPLLSLSTDFIDGAVVVNFICEYNVSVEIVLNCIDQRPLAIHTVQISKFTYHHRLKKRMTGLGISYLSMMQRILVTVLCLKI